MHPRFAYEHDGRGSTRRLHTSVPVYLDHYREGTSCSASTCHLLPEQVSTAKALTARRLTEGGPKWWGMNLKPHRAELPGEPNYPKMPGEPKRVQPSKDRDLKDS